MSISTSGCIFKLFVCPTSIWRSVIFESTSNNFRSSFAVYGNWRVDTIISRLHNLWKGRIKKLFWLDFEAMSTYQSNLADNFFLFEHWECHLDDNVSDLTSPFDHAAWHSAARTHYFRKMLFISNSFIVECHYRTIRVREFLYTLDEDINS